MYKQCFYKKLYKIFFLNLFIKNLIKIFLIKFYGQRLFDKVIKKDLKKITKNLKKTGKQNFLKN